MWSWFLFLKDFSFMYSWETHTHRKREREIERQRHRQRHRQREKQAPCREPNVGLDPQTPGSCPGLKAGAKPLSHPGVPNTAHLKKNRNFQSMPWHQLRRISSFADYLYQYMQGKLMGRMLPIGIYRSLFLRGKLSNVYCAVFVLHS